MIERVRMKITNDRKLLLLLAALLLPACIHIHPSGVALAENPGEGVSTSTSFELSEGDDSDDRRQMRGMPPVEEIRRLQGEIAQLKEQIAQLQSMLAERGGMMRPVPGGAARFRTEELMSLAGRLFSSEARHMGDDGNGHHDHGHDAILLLELAEEMRGQRGGGHDHEGHEHDGHDHAEWHFDERHFEGELPMISMEFRDESRFGRRGEQFRQLRGRDRGMNRWEMSGRRPMRVMNPRMRNLTPRWNQGMTPAMPRGLAARQGMGAMRGGAFPRGVIMGRTGAMPGMQPWGPQGGIVAIEPGMGHGEMMFHGADGNFAIFGETGAGHSRSCGSEECGEEKECPYLKSQCEEDSDCCGSEECGEEKECPYLKNQCEEDSDCCGSEECGAEKECPYMKERNSECCGDDGCCKGEKKSGTKVIMIRKESGDSGDMYKELLDTRVEVFDSAESVYENTLGSPQMIVEMISDYLPEDLELKGDVDIQIHTDIEGADLPPGMEEELKEMLEKMMLEVEVEMKETGKSGKKRATDKDSQKESKKKAANKKQAANKKKAASKKQAANKKQAAQKKSAEKKSADKKKSVKKDSKSKESKKKQNRKKGNGAVKKSESGSSLEIRVRELSRLGVPVF